MDAGPLLIAAAVAAIALLAAGSGPINGDAAAYAAQARAGDLADRWTHWGYLALARVLSGQGLDGISIAASSATVLCAAALARRSGADPHLAAAGAAAAVLPWAAFAEVDPLWIALVCGAAAVQSRAAAGALLACAVAVSPAALLALPWVCAIRGDSAALLGAAAAVVALTALSKGGWWLGERGVLRGEALLVGRTLSAWGRGAPWPLLPAWLAAGGDRRLGWLAPLLLLPPDVPGWTLGAVALAVGAAAAPAARRPAWRLLAALALVLAAGELGARAVSVREENAVVARLAAELGPDDGLIAPWTWGARVAVAASGDPYGIRWHPPGRFLRDQRAAWCRSLPRRAAQLPPEPDGTVAWTEAELGEGCW